MVQWKKDTERKPGKTKFMRVLREGLADLVEADEANWGYENHYIHVGPLIRKENHRSFFLKLKFPVSKYKYLMLSIRNPFRYCLVKILFRSFVLLQEERRFLIF